MSGQDEKREDNRSLIKYGKPTIVVAVLHRFQVSERKERIKLTGKTEPKLKLNMCYRLYCHQESTRRRSSSCTSSQC
jgi:hypothetical protein